LYGWDTFLLLDLLLDLSDLAPLRYQFLSPPAIRDWKAKKHRKLRGGRKR
jgi:hypothetical protein